METLTVPESLVIRHTIAGRPMFIATCDDTTLRWLGAAFRALGPRRTFVIGDGLPIGSDSDCLITVVAAGRGQSPTMTAPAPGAYGWSLPEAEARRMAVMIAGMAAFSGPCHQYLESTPDLPVVLVSKGEYDGPMLRRMRGQRDSP